MRKARPGDERNQENLQHKENQQEGPAFGLRDFSPAALFTISSLYDVKMHLYGTVI